MPRPRPKHLHRQIDRHGNTVWYFRRGHGARIRIRGEYGSEEFWNYYEAALINGRMPEQRKVDSRSLSWLITRYKTSTDWAALSAATRRQRDNIFYNVEKTGGRAAFTDVTALVIQEGMDRRRETPAQALSFLKAMRGLFRWAAKMEHVPVDPTAAIKAAEPKSAGFHTWTDAEVERFEARWPLGTRERVALAVLLYTGLRRGDATRLGPAMVQDGIISMRTEKTDTEVNIPVLPELQAVLDAGPTGATTYISRQDGEPFVKESFGNWFRRACTQAKVPGSAHGLRKAGATRAANNGATERQLNAIFGWADGSDESATYTRNADRRRLAKDGISKLLR